MSKVTCELDVRAQIILTFVFFPLYCPAFLCVRKGSASGGAQRRALYPCSLEDWGAVYNLYLKAAAR